jgi:hypothetical protein
MEQTEVLIYFLIIAAAAWLVIRYWKTGKKG